MKTRYAFLFFNICEYKVLETYLCNMAEKGWALDSIYGYVMVFTKKKQPKRKYYVDFNMSSDVSVNAHFHDMVEEFGYEYIAGNNLLGVFGSDEDMEIPIRGDDEITRQQLRKAGRWTNWGNLLLGVLWFAMGCMNLFRYTDNIVYSVGLISSSIIQLLTSLIWLCLSWPYFKWCICKKTTFTLWSIQLRTYFMLLCVCILLSGIFQYFPLVLFFSILVLLGFLLLLKWLWEAKEYTFLRCITALVVLIFSCVLMGSNLVYTYYKSHVNTTLKTMQTMIDAHMVKQGYQKDSVTVFNEDSLLLSQKESDFMFHGKTMTIRLFQLHEGFWKERIGKDVVSQLCENEVDLQKAQFQDIQVWKNKDTAIYLKDDFIIYVYSEEQKGIENAFIQTLFVVGENKSK